MAKQVSNSEVVQKLKVLINKMQKVNRIAAQTAKELKSEAEAEKYQE